MLRWKSLIQLSLKLEHKFSALGNQIRHYTPSSYMFVNTLHARQRPFQHLLSQLVRLQLRNSPALNGASLGHAANGIERKVIFEVRSEERRVGKECRSR